DVCSSDLAQHSISLPATDDPDDRSGWMGRYRAPPRRDQSPLFLGRTKPDLTLAAPQFGLHRRWTPPPSGTPRATTTHRRTASRQPRGPLMQTNVKPDEPRLER